LLTVCGQSNDAHVALPLQYGANALTHDCVIVDQNDPSRWQDGRRPQWTNPGVDSHKRSTGLNLRSTHPVRSAPRHNNADQTREVRLPHRVEAPAMPIHVCGHFSLQSSFDNIV